MSNSSIILRRLIALILVATFAACAAKRPAPVIESRPATPAKPPVVETKPATPPSVPEAKPAEADKVYVIQKGDTLISIALANGLDYRELAMWNNIENPNVIKLGDALRLTAPVTNVVVTAAGAQPKPGEPVATPLIIAPAPVTGSPSGNTDTVKTEPKATKVPYTDSAYIKMTADAAAASTPAATPAPVAVAPAAPVAVNPAIPASDDVSWAWPIQPLPKGRIIANFTDANKGIDISGAKNSPIVAAADGKVIYAQAGLRGYGRLVILKHNNTWLSAYAHNEKIVVTEGQDVKKGQKIAEMGNSDTDQVKLHFEIRKQGKPVDPVKLLPSN